MTNTPSDGPTTSLRQRLIEGIDLHRLSRAIKRNYLRDVTQALHEIPTLGIYFDRFAFRRVDASSMQHFLIRKWVERGGLEQKAAENDDCISG